MMCRQLVGILDSRARELATNLGQLGTREAKATGGAESRDGSRPENKIVLCREQKRLSAREQNCSLTTPPSKQLQGGARRGEPPAEWRSKPGTQQNSRR